MRKSKTKVIALVISMLLVTFYNISAGLDVYWIDVEGGAATLIVTPANESILIDSGIPGERDPKRIYKVASETAKLSRIDHLITTHFDIDHFGGVADLAKLIPIINLWDTGVPDKDPEGRSDERFQRLVKPYKEMKVEKRNMIRAGDFIPLKVLSADKPVLKLKCLAAKKEFIKPSEKAVKNPLCVEERNKIKEMNDNANCVVLLLEYGGFKLYLGADLLWDLERQLVCPVNLVGVVDVYQVTHHGLDFSNNPILVKSLSPTVAIMPNGVTKGCEPETFATLRALPSIEAIYQLHKNLRKDSQNNTQDEFIANLERECNGNFIKLSVAADAKTYTVSIPAKGHSREFKTKTK